MLSVSARRLARKSLKFAKIDEAWRSGGRKTTSTTSGSGGYYWQGFYPPDEYPDRGSDTVFADQVAQRPRPRR